jgi:MFS family permease
VLRLIVLWLAGTNLRLTVLAVPPVLPLIHRQFDLSEQAVGALSGLPVLLLGLAAIPGSLLIARLGRLRGRYRRTALRCRGLGGTRHRAIEACAVRDDFFDGGRDRSGTAGPAGVGRRMVYGPARFRDRGLC